jgi:hypothetical protein
MEGTEEVRFCNQCNLNVYNISAMTRKEALSLIQQTEGRLCIKLYRRYDGTIITSNCPQGLRFLQQRLTRFSSTILAAFLSVPAWLTNTYASPITDGQSAQHFSKKSGQNKRHRRIKRNKQVTPTMGVMVSLEVPPVISPTIPFMDTSLAPPAKIEINIPPPPPMKEP